MKFAALGRTHWLYDSILSLQDAGHELVLLGTCKASPEYKINENDFEALAKKLHCHYFCDPKINAPQYVEMIKQSGAEVAISVNWLTLIKAPILNLFKHGVINAHAGDLPRYRGNACPNWAILMGEEKVVLTLHQMTEELDAGDILVQKSYQLTEKTYITDVYQFLTENIPILFTETLNGLANQSLAPCSQPSDPILSLRCFPRRPEDSEIDWTKSAEDILRLVRASADPFDGAYSYLKNEKIYVIKARSLTLKYPCIGVPGQIISIDQQNGEVFVLSGNGVVVLEKLRTFDHSELLASDVIKSKRMRLGFNIHEKIDSLEKTITALKKIIQSS